MKRFILYIAFFVIFTFTSLYCIFDLLTKADTVANIVGLIWFVLLAYVATESVESLDRKE
jgi:hypothetical protein